MPRLPKSGSHDRHRGSLPRRHDGVLCTRIARFAALDARQQLPDFGPERPKLLCQRLLFVLRCQIINGQRMLRLDLCDDGHVVVRMALCRCNSIQQPIRHPAERRQHYYSPPFRPFRHQLHCPPYTLRRTDGRTAELGNVEGAS